MAYDYWQYVSYPAEGGDVAYWQNLATGQVSKQNPTIDSAWKQETYPGEGGDITFWTNPTTGEISQSAPQAANNLVADPSGSYYANTPLPDFAPSLPPPQAITINCLPFNSYTAGEANPDAGNLYSQSFLPVNLLNARILLSRVAAINTNPPFVVTGPP